MNANRSLNHIALVALPFLFALAATPMAFSSRSYADDEKTVAEKRAAQAEAAQAAASEQEAKATIERQFADEFGDAESEANEREPRPGRGDNAENRSRATRDMVQRSQRVKQLQERIADLEHQIEQRRTNNEDTEDLLNEIEGLRKERQNLGEIPDMQGLKRQLQVRVEGLNKRIQELENQQRFDEAADLRRDIERTKSQFERLNRVFAEQSSENAPGEGQLSRDDHLRIAAEHLHAAGMHEMAERMTQEAARRAGSDSRPERRPGENNAEAVAQHQEASRREMSRQREVMDMVRKVHDEMSSMRKEIEELRALLNKNREVKPDASQETESHETDSHETDPK